MSDYWIEKIEDREDFEFLIDEVIEKTKLKIRKNIFDASVLNDNKKQLISYYENERQKILKKLKKDSWSFRVNFKNDDIKINKEDYEQLFIYTSWEYDNLERIKGFKEYDKEYYLEQAASTKKDLFKFHKLRLKDIKNNIWLSFFNLNIKELKGSSGIDYNSLVFDKPESEDFFIYLVDNWLKNEVHKTTALRFIFTEMWYNTTEKETPYKITSSQPYFAREYWNKNYSNLLKLHPKNPKLKNTDISNDYYCKRFKNLLTEFQGG